MHIEGDSIHVNEAEASGGSKEGVVRWVLIVGTMLAILFLSIIWITGALTRDSNPPAEDASAGAQMEAGSDAANPLAPAPGADGTDLGNDREPTAKGQTTTKDKLSVVKNDPPD